MIVIIITIAKDFEIIIFTGIFLHSRKSKSAEYYKNRNNPLQITLQAYLRTKQGLLWLYSQQEVRYRSAD